MKHLLDTDTCIHLLRGRPAYVANALKTSPDELAISSITRYELIYGALGCANRRRTSERAKVEKFLGVLHEIPFSQEAADHAAEIRQELEIHGSVIGPMDILIAATARAANLEVITDNLREFNRVPRLKCRSWKSP